MLLQRVAELSYLSTVVVVVVAAVAVVGASKREFHMVIPYIQSSRHSSENWILSGFKVHI